MKRPLVWLLLLFCLGIIAASRIKITFLWAYCFAAAMLIFTFLLFRKALAFNIFLSCLVFLLGFALFKNYQILPKRHILRYISYKNNSPYVIKGFIKSEPLVKNNKTTFIFQAEEIKSASSWSNCYGDILVYVSGRKDLHYAEELVLSGNLCRPFGSLKGRSYRNYLYNQGIRLIMHVQATNFALRLNNYRGSALKRFALWSKVKMEEVILKHNSSVAAGILEAMLLGEKRDVPLLINNAMIKSGTVHILVVSGFNVGIVAFALILFLKLIRLPKIMRFYLAVSLLAFYCLLTGASAPVVRATVMAAVFMVGFFLKKEPDIYNSLSIAAFFILGVNPAQLFDIGFQLSFASVISIVYLYPALSQFVSTFIFRKSGVYPQIKYIRLIIDGCLVSFSAWLGTAGFIACYFKVFSPITVFANLFIVPLATLITLCGFSLIMAGLIFPPLSAPFASTCELLVKLLLNINAFLIKLPGAYFRF